MMMIIMGQPLVNSFPFPRLHICLIKQSGSGFICPAVKPSEIHTFSWINLIVCFQDTVVSVEFFFLNSIQLIIWYSLLKYIKKLWVCEAYS